MNCPNCHTANPEHARFCMNCRSGLIALSAAHEGQVPSFDLSRYIPRELAVKLDAARLQGRLAGERRIMLTGFPDFQTNIDDLIAAGDKVAARITT